MFTKFDTPMKLTAIFGLVLVFALSVAWATINTYNGSAIIENGSTQDEVIQLVQQGSDQIKVQIAAGLLDAYMTEESLNEVEITCELTEEFVSDPNGDYYKMSFEFGPSGAYFDLDPLILKIKGKWVAEDTQFWLYDETGEAIPGTRHDEADMIRFEIDHFSCYYYEQYCY